jgi:hypothetical protein
VYGASAPPVPPAKNRRTVVIWSIAGVTALVLTVCGTGSVIAYNALTGASYSKGDCVKEEKTSGGSKALPVSCGDAGAYKIVAKLDGTTSTLKCPPAPASDASFVSYEDEYVLCMKRAG